MRKIGSSRTFVPIKDRNGEFLIRLSPKLIQEIEKEFGFILHSRHEFYTRMWDDTYEGIKCVPYKEYYGEDNFSHFSPIMKKITKAWLSVHPDYKK